MTAPFTIRLPGGWKPASCSTHPERFGFTIGDDAVEWPAAADYSSFFSRKNARSFSISASVIVL